MTRSQKGLPSVALSKRVEEIRDAVWLASYRSNKEQIVATVFSLQLLQ